MEASNNNQGSRNLWFLSEIHIVTRTFFPHLEWFVYCNSTMTNNYYMYTLWSTSGISWFCWHLGGSYSNCVWLINFFVYLQTWVKNDGGKPVLCNNRPFAAKPSRDLLFIKLWATALKIPEMEKACREYQNSQIWGSRHYKMRFYDSLKF